MAQELYSFVRIGQVFEETQRAINLIPIHMMTGNPRLEEHMNSKYFRRCFPRV